MLNKPAELFYKISKLAKFCRIWSPCSLYPSPFVPSPFFDLLFTSFCIHFFLSLSIYFLLQLFVFFFTSCLCSLSFILYDAVVFLSRHCMSLSLSLILLFVSCFCMFMKEAYRLKNQGSKTFCCDS